MAQVVGIIVVESNVFNAQRPLDRRMELNSKPLVWRDEFPVETYKSCVVFAVVGILLVRVALSILRLRPTHQLEPDELI